MLLEVCLSLLISVLPVLISLIQKEIIDYLADYIPSVDKLPRVFYEYCVYGPAAFRVGYISDGGRLYQ